MFHGDGEEPIHADIVDGTAATRQGQALAAAMLLYFAGLAFVAMRSKGKRVAALLQQRLDAEHQARALGLQLQDALAKVLSGFVAICANCKHVREADGGRWVAVEGYVSSRTDAKFSHTVCPTCAASLYGHRADDPP